MAEQRQNNVALTDEEKEQRAKKRNRTIITVVSVVAAVLIVVIVLLLLLVKCEPEENVDPPVEHTHTYSSWVVVDEPTCTEEGLRERTCSCGEKETEKIAALGHTAGEAVKENEKAPTCTAAGYTSYETCTRCGYSNRETIPAAGHQGGTATCQAQAVCEVCHEPYGELGDHTPDKTDYIADEKEHWSLCTLCNAEVTVEHVFEGEQNCAICGVTDSKYFTFTLPYGGTTYEIEKNASSVLSGAVKLPNYHNGTLITEIDYGAFGHEALTSIEIPEGFTSIGYYAFRGCASLESITIPDSVESIRMSSFEGCTSLENVTIPNGVTQIRESAFRDCTALKSINIPESVTMIEIWVFRGCTGLTSVEFADTASTWSIRKDFNEPLAITPSGDAQKDAEMLATTYWEYTWRKQTD